MTLQQCEISLGPIIVFKCISLCIYKAVLHYVVSNTQLSEPAK